jgi:hypothetical protein
MGEIKAIETIYAGHRFRSRLEARWAVVFDALGIRWEYEAEGFATSAGRYLPDFRFGSADSDQPRLWAEVKGDSLSAGDARKVMAFAFDPGEPRWIVALGPIPDHGCQSLFTGWGLVDGAPRAMSWHLGALTGWRALGDSYGEPEGDTLPQFSGHFRRKVFYYPGLESAATYAALDAGRMARFEHGESGR